MSNIIYTSYVTKHTDSIVLTTSFEDVINKIKSEELSGIVNKIRNETDKRKRTELKNNLPAFFPTVFLNNEKNLLNDNSKATGIIQFDVDTQDNISLDFDLFRSAISGLKETFYIFKSPSNGLKFAIKTDFNRHTDEDIESFKARFKIAYEKVKSYIEEATINFNVDYDKSVGNIKWLCYLSHDKDIYFNQDCHAFKVDPLCVYEKKEIRLSTEQVEDKGQVLDILSNISRDLDYPDRFKVNSVVIDALGYEALSVLESHWTTKSRDKLRKDIEGQIKQSGKENFKANLGTLVNYAKANGWKAITGSARNKLQTKETTLTLPDLLGPEEASLKLKEIIEDFFKNKKSRFINFSTGAGKTYTMLQILEDIGWHTRIIYLVKSHELAEEIKNTFNLIKKERSTIRTFKEKHSGRSSINHLKGRAELCENDAVIKSLVPAWFCHSDVNREISESDTCIYQADCRYTAQFNNLGSIRVMTHNEYVNAQGKYFNGVDAYGEVRKSKWVPEYLIIDEDIFTVEEDFKEGVGSRFKVISKILIDVQSGVDLRDAILANQTEIFIDALENVRDAPQEFLISLSKTKSKSIQLPKFSDLFYNITQYAKTEDLDYLHGMRVEGSYIIQSVIKSVAERYKKIPTMYLDATANKAIIEKLLPNVEYHSISVKSKNDINLYQLQNKNFSKEEIKKEGVIDVVILGLKRLADKYKNEGKSVGLITHKTLKDITNNTEFNDFDEFLANKTGIDMFGHFGGLRGLNKFNDVDCLIILSRQQLPPDAIQSNTYAIFNEAGDAWTRDSNSYINSLVRMKDGSVRKHNSQISLDEKTRAVKEHYSLSETKQAIGRGRMVHGKSKDIYFLSNEYIGSDIEVTGFLNYRDLFSKDIIDDCKLEALKARGFIECKQIEIMRAFGLTKIQVQNNKDEINTIIKMSGFSRVEIIYKDSNRNTVKREFFISNISLLMEELKSKMKTFISCLTID